MRHLLDEGITPNLRLSKLVVAFAEFLCYTGCSSTYSHLLPVGTGVTPQKDDIKEFMLILRQALLMIVRWIEKRYGLLPNK